MKEEKRPSGLLALLAKKLKENRRLEYVVYGGILVLILLLALSSFQTKKAGEPGLTVDAAVSAQNGDLDTERRLEKILSNISGAGKVTVMITYESGPELVPAMSVDTNTNRAESADGGKSTNSEQKTETSKPAVISGQSGSEPIVLTQIEPMVRGVIVVAEGAGNIGVRMDLQRAVQTVLSVPAGCIEVFEMQNNSMEEES